MFLKTLGVKNQFVVYENEGHRIVSDHRVDIMKRTVRFANLSGGQAATHATTEPSISISRRSE
jgi:hypothetical protein